MTQLGRNLRFSFNGVAPATEPWWEANEVPATTPETRSFRKRTFKDYNREVSLPLAGNAEKLLIGLAWLPVARFDAFDSLVTKHDGLR